MRPAVGAGMISRSRAQSELSRRLVMIKSVDAWVHVLPESQSYENPDCWAGCHVTFQYEGASWMLGRAGV